MGVADEAVGGVALRGDNERGCGSIQISFYMSEGCKSGYCEGVLLSVLVAWGARMIA